MNNEFWHSIEVRNDRGQQLTYCCFPSVIVQRDIILIPRSRYVHCQKNPSYVQLVLRYFPFMNEVFRNNYRNINYNLKYPM